MATLATLFDGQVSIVTIPNSKKLQMSFKMPDGWVRYSAGTDDLDTAKSAALVKWEELQAEHNRQTAIAEARKLLGIVDEKPAVKFKVAALEYQRLLEEKIANGVSIAIEPGYVGVVKNWLLPYLGEYDIDKLGDAEIADFEHKRLLKIGATLSKSTINMHNVVLRGVFDLAAMKGYRKRGDFPRLTVKGKGVRTNARAPFEPKEIKPLLNFMWRWSYERGGGVDSATIYKRRLLCCWTGILLLSGLRPGEETERLHWRHVEQDAVDDNGEPCVFIHMPHRKNSKDGEIKLVHCDRTINIWLNFLKRVTRRHEPNDLLFPMMDGQPAKFTQMFYQCLEEMGIRLNANGKERVPYSCRHTYATAMIQRGEDWGWLAENMDTSINMLNQHYGHLKARKPVRAGKTAINYEQLLREAAGPLEEQAASIAAFDAIDRKTNKRDTLDSRIADLAAFKARRAQKE